MSKLCIQPLTYREACAYVKRYHRHHEPPQGWAFGCGAMRDRQLVGVIMVGRPVSRHLQDGWTAEVIRCCVKPGEPHVCSKLYATAWRAAQALGYLSILTYTLENEAGASLKAAGWKDLGPAGGGNWDKPSRPRQTTAPTCGKRIWVAGEWGEARKTRLPRAVVDVPGVGTMEQQELFVELGSTL